MKSSTDFLPCLPQSFLLIGPSGSGKTTVSLQLPKPFILDCDLNLNGPVRFLSRQGRLGKDWFYDTPVKNADGTPCPRANQYERCHDLLLEACNNPNVETVVVSSLSSFASMLMVQTLKLQGKKISLDADPKTLDTQMTQPDWGAYAHLFNKFLFWLKSSGKRIVFEAHIEVKEDELTKVDENVIAFPGSTKYKLAGFFEEVWLLSVRITGVGPSQKAEHFITTRPDNKNARLGLKSAAQLGTSFPADMVNVLQALQK